MLSCRAKYRPRKIGICKNTIKQPPSGLTPCLRYSSISPAVVALRSSLYFSWIFFSSGASSCILHAAVIACLRLIGNIRPRTTPSAG